MADGKHGLRQQMAIKKCFYTPDLFIFWFVDYYDNAVYFAAFNFLYV